MYCNKINDQKWVIFQTSHSDFGRTHQMSQRLLESFNLKILSKVVCDYHYRSHHLCPLSSPSLDIANAFYPASQIKVLKYGYLGHNTFRLSRWSFQIKISNASRDTLYSQNCAPSATGHSSGALWKYPPARNLLSIFTNKHATNNIKK